MFDPNHLPGGYALTWPRELLHDELAAVVDGLKDRDQRPALDLLFEEALRGPHPIEDLAAVPDGPTPKPYDPWGPKPHPSDEEPPANWCREFGRSVLAYIDDLPVYAPRVYFLWRNRPADADTSARSTDWLALQREWTGVVEDLVAKGYLDRRAGDVCEDGKENEQPERIEGLIRESCGMGDRWPLALDDGDVATDEDYFFTLVEVFHDLVARPRLREWHSYDEHYRYSAFDDLAGQAVYRWKVNELLARHGVQLELAGTGEDRGLLVRTPGDGDARQQLVANIIAAPGPESDEIRHAIAQFRSRDSGIPSKRSACQALHRVLEDRRQLLKEELLSKDEGALFQIANQFDIRHRNADQRSDYDEAYLDWIFWWYLATIELTNRLIGRQPA